MNPELQFYLSEFEKDSRPVAKNAADDLVTKIEFIFPMDASFWLGLQNDYDLLEE